MLFRIILDEPREPALAHAVSQAILEEVAAGRAPPTVRIFSATRRFLSIGALNDPESILREGKRPEIVRRFDQSHMVEITPTTPLYECVLPWKPDYDLAKAMTFMEQGLYPALENAKLHNPWRTTRHTIFVGDEPNHVKVAGHGQRIVGKYILTSGILFYDHDGPESLSKLLKVEEDKLSHMGALETLSPGLTLEKMQGLLFEAFKNHPDVKDNYEIGVLTERELQRARELEPSYRPNGEWTMYGMGTSKTARVCATDFTHGNPDFKTGEKK